VKIQPRLQVDGELAGEISPASDAPLVRVVIPAFGTTDKIAEVVAAALASRGLFELEVVVVDDGNNVDLQQALCGLCVSIVGTGGSGSAAIARNTGASGFHGDFIVFIDSDVVVDEWCIDHLLRPMRGHRAEATVGNYSKNVAGLPFASQYKQLYVSMVYERRSGYLRNEFWTATGAIDTAVFHCIGGFNQRFRGAGGEDTELGARLTNQGYRVLAVPEALGDHHHRMSMKQLLLNDWRKGLLAMGCFFESEGAITNNRHATRRDILSVGIADLAVVLLLLSPLLYGFLGRPMVLALLLAVMSYIGFRADILRAFSSQGISFVVRAFGVMFLLDLTRSACFAAGVGLRIRAHGAKSSQPSGSEAAAHRSADDPSHPTHIAASEN
jgi:cellulose synthase/poly-beta-1,6-N-acetylglucosamine synthase-like glycosyltransferase